MHAVVENVSPKVWVRVREPCVRLCILDQITSNTCFFCVLLVAVGSDNIVSITCERREHVLSWRTPASRCLIESRFCFFLGVVVSRETHKELEILNEPS